MNWIQITLALVQLMPEVLKLIIQVEQIIGAGQGSLKKDLVMQGVNASGAEPSFTSRVSTIVDNIVTKLNAAGVLPKKIA